MSATSSTPDPAGSAEAEIARSRCTARGRLVELQDGRSFAGDELLVAAGGTSTQDSSVSTRSGCGQANTATWPSTSTCRSRPRLALGRRGRQRSRPAYPHGRAPGPRGRRPDRGQVRRRALEVADGAGAPRVTFTEPQVAAVGLTEQAARDRGIDVQIVSAGTSSQRRRRVLGREVSGHLAAGDRQTPPDRRRRDVHRLRGAGHAPSRDLRGVGELTLEQLWHGIAPFPTRSEVWLNLLDATGLWRER